LSLKESPVFEAREDIIDGIAVDKRQLEQTPAHDGVLAKAIACHQRHGSGSCQRTAPVRNIG